MATDLQLVICADTQGRQGICLDNSISRDLRIMPEEQALKYVAQAWHYLSLPTTLCSPSRSKNKRLIVTASQPKYVRV